MAKVTKHLRNKARVSKSGTVAKMRSTMRPTEWTKLRIRDTQRQQQTQKKKVQSSRSSLKSRMRNNNNDALDGVLPVSELFYRSTQSMSDDDDEDAFAQ